MKSTTITQSRKELPVTKTLRKVLLTCGILASLLFIGTDILAGSLWKGYSFTSRSISELSAIGAPTRPLVAPLDLTYDLLMIAFGLGTWGLAGQKRALRVTVGLLVGKAVIDLVGAFFPMHLSEALNTFANTMNVIFTGMGVIFFLLAIGFGAAANQNWFRLYSIGTLLLFLVLGILGLLVVPQIAAGQPMSRVGVQERTMLYGCLLWVVVLAISLLRAEKNTIDKTLRKTMAK